MVHRKWNSSGLSKPNVTSTMFDFALQMIPLKSNSSTLLEYLPNLDHPFASDSFTSDRKIEWSDFSTAELQYVRGDYNWELTTNYMNCSSKNITNCTNESDMYHVGWKSIMLGILLAFFSVVTILGNLLVIIAVAKERYLRTVTNYLVVSLACADVIVGVIVMPFAISLEVTNQHWYFGHVWCDLWHSFDVLGSTGSIMNLCVISLDRYWAVSDPIQYPRKMSRSRTTISIILVWVCSAIISFPAIGWWRSVMPSGIPETKCLFTEEPAYLILSSVISFYIPLFIMIFVYWRIYRTAIQQIRTLKTGSKKMTKRDGKNGVEVLLLRVHRGGGATLSCNGSISMEDTTISRRQTENDLPSPRESTSGSFASGSGDYNSNNNMESNGHGGRSAKHLKQKLRNFANKRRISKIARERKAAKTLGIVMGVFVICWAPFFILNLILAICKNCVSHVEIIFPVFTWLGYINSGMNPVIYACSMKDFRRAFIRITCAFSSRRRRFYVRTVMLKNKKSRSLSSTMLHSIHRDSEYSSVSVM